MIVIEWDPQAREFLKKLPKEIAQRIYRKVDTEIKHNVERHLEFLVGMDEYKIRIGDYRLFVNYFNKEGILQIISIRHRKDAYKE